ncbi:hypothetical protein MCRO_0504 [Mycoplasma crocodyli MP145]|uniref:Uncharacterized protein n=1 Tax=Mycoplasma crocodyli (strain ATCC 51981 / MP145) TaxID=512564 RepID=D5E5T3_MYCCM|nr:hypothetical protein MCRO_0504 [Mycoplasma crocodyli MP145]
MKKLANSLHQFPFWSIKTSFNYGVSGVIYTLLKYKELIDNNFGYFHSLFNVHTNLLYV